MGANFWMTLHIPGPMKPPPGLQLLKSNANGGLMPVPDANSMRYPVPTVIDTFRVAVVPIATEAKSTRLGRATATLMPLPWRL